MEFSYLTGDSYPT